METSLQPLLGEGEAEEGFGGWGSRGHTWGRLQPGPAPISRDTHSITLGAGRSGGCCRLMGSAPRYRSPQVSPGSEGVQALQTPRLPGSPQQTLGPRCERRAPGSVQCRADEAAQPSSGEQARDRLRVAAGSSPCLPDDMHNSGEIFI